MLRSNIERVTFRHGFMLKGMDAAPPPGTYDIEIDEELLEGLSFMVRRRMSTAVRIPSGIHGSTPSQIIPMSDLDLEAIPGCDRWLEVAPCA